MEVHREIGGNRGKYGSVGQASSTDMLTSFSERGEVGVKKTLACQWRKVAYPPRGVAWKTFFLEVVGVKMRTVYIYYSRRCISIMREGTWGKSRCERCIYIYYSRRCIWVRGCWLEHVLRG